MHPYYQPVQPIPTQTPVRKSLTFKTVANCDILCPSVEFRFAFFTPREVKYNGSSIAYGCQW